MPSALLRPGAPRMRIGVAALGALITAVAVYGLIATPRLLAAVSSFRSTRGWGLAVGLRTALGAFLILAAADCRAPGIVRALGGLTLAAAAILLIIGPQRFVAWIDWWLGRPLWVMRAWLLLGVGIGALLFYASV